MHVLKPLPHAYALMRQQNLWIPAVLLASLIAGRASAESEIAIPASTCYAIPAESGVRITTDGATRWRNAEVGLRWFGKLEHSGGIEASVAVRAIQDGIVALSLTIGNQTHTSKAEVKAGQELMVSFPQQTIDDAGFVSFTLQSVVDNPNCDVLELRLTGASVKDAHFNRKPRRNAASVHLAYPIPKGKRVTAFYCEMTALEDPIWSYYMSCGWHRGYFGMQVNSPSERRIIFSVWDSGGEPTDRNKVADENRVRLVDKGEGVYSGDFGNEGTGGHSHLKYNWETGKVQRFLVTAEPVDESHTVFSGYYFHPDKSEWMLISSWNAPKEGKHLRGLYSFSENFVGRNGHVLRKAYYDNQWILTAEGQWIEITDASFSHDPTGKEDRLDRFMGIEGNKFFLSHGGFTDGFTAFGKRFSRPQTGRSPENMKLPPLPTIGSNKIRMRDHPSADGDSNR